MNEDQLMEHLRDARLNTEHGESALHVFTHKDGTKAAVSVNHRGEAELLASSRLASDLLRGMEMIETTAWVKWGARQESTNNQQKEQNQ